MTTRYGGTARATADAVFGKLCHLGRGHQRRAAIVAPDWVESRPACRRGHLHHVDPSTGDLSEVVLRPRPLPGARRRRCPSADPQPADTSVSRRLGVRGRSITRSTVPDTFFATAQRRGSQGRDLGRCRNPRWIRLPPMILTGAVDRVLATAAPRGSALTKRA